MTKKPRRKLTIRREAVRKLDGVDLRQVRGGESEATCVTWKPNAQEPTVGCSPG
jgi:hypothetical protein